MTECSACGTELDPHQSYCPTCGKATAYYHRQRRCLHCNTPAAEETDLCMMCGQPVDRLPLSDSIFSGSWWGIVLGLLIVGWLVYTVVPIDIELPDNNDPPVLAAAPPTPTATATLTPTKTATITPSPGPTTTSTATPTATVTSTATPQTHIIQSGETLLFVAELYNVTVEELMALNGIEDVTSLQIGQTIVLPPSIQPDSSTQNVENVPYFVYTIQAGDTVLDIALNYGTTAGNLIALNPGLNLDLIYEGQGIVVPLPTPTATLTPTITPTPTFTPSPDYISPDLLTPIDGQLVEGPVLLFSWTATKILAEDEFYVLQLAWPDGSFSEAWLKQSSWRITSQERPDSGLIKWSVSIMRQTETSPAGTPLGIRLSYPQEERTVQWP